MLDGPSNIHLQALETVQLNSTAVDFESVAALIGSSGSLAVVGVSVCRSISTAQTRALSARSTQCIVNR